MSDFAGGQLCRWATLQVGLREVGGRGKGGARLFEDAGGEAVAGPVREGKRKRLVETSLLPCKPV